MNIDKIEKLLERYYDAQTTETEEQELKRFFAHGDVPVHLLAERELFLQLQASADASVPEGLEERLSWSIDAWELREQRTRKVQRRARIIHLQWIGSVAASLLILVAFGWYMYKPASIRQDTCATPEETYAEAQKALAMFSTVLNKGMKQMETVHATTERVEKNIQKQFNKICE